MQTANLFTSFAIGGFWYHCKLLANNIYRDQHNNIWIRKENHFISECGGMQAEVPKPQLKGWVSSKDLFLQQRESDYAYYHGRRA